MTQQNSPTSPSLPVIKQLFAHSGNRCAFPRCDCTLILHDVVIGEICHIKAANPKGPRYDPEQTPAERHAYANLVLLCANHHKVVDDDEESYTVERLTKIKEDHEASLKGFTGDAERGAQLLLDHSVRTVGQSGGVTAHTFNQTINLHHPLPNPSDEARRQNDARRVLAPELQRTIQRVIYIHSRALANFVCHSAENEIKPNDQKRDFIPYWPSLYPSAPQVKDLADADAMALVAFYDSLHALSDSVNDWWDREEQLPVNLFGSFLSGASRSLKLALACIERFSIQETPSEVWNNLAASINRAHAIEQEASKHHIARFQAKAEAEKAARLQQQRTNRR